MFILVPVLLLKEPNYPIGMIGFSVFLSKAFTSLGVSLKEFRP